MRYLYSFCVFITRVEKIASNARRGEESEGDVFGIR